MADMMSPEIRSRLMARIRATNTRPELLLRNALEEKQVGVRGWAHDLPGTPDLVSTEARLAVFVDGCFWHGCPTHYHAPTTRRAFWKRKLVQNHQRRMVVRSQLELIGWLRLGSGGAVEDSRP